MEMKDSLLLVIFILAVSALMARVGYGWGVKQTKTEMKQEFSHVLNFADRRPAEVGDILLMKDGSAMIFTETGWKDLVEIPAR
jgi:hypothetical protein